MSRDSMISAMVPVIESSDSADQVGGLGYFDNGLDLSIVQRCGQMWRLLRSDVETALLPSIVQRCD